MFQKSSTLPPVVYDTADYHAADKHGRGHPDFTMSRSALRKFAKCPHRWLAGHEEETTDCMADGSLADVITLTPERLEKVYAICPETYPATQKKKDDPIEQKPWNWNANYCAEWREARFSEGKEVVKSGDISDAWEARKALFQNEHIAAFHEISKKQVLVNVEWNDADTGIIVPVKALLDIVPDPESEFGDTLADFKRTNDASYRKWARTVHSMGLHYQAAFYIDAINAALGSKYRNFEHHIQESFAPWESTHRLLAAEFITIGRNAYQADFKDYCRALKTGKFRGYDCAMVEPEAWMLSDQ